MRCWIVALIAALLVLGAFLCLNFIPVRTIEISLSSYSAYVFSDTYGWPSKAHERYAELSEQGLQACATQPAEPWDFPGVAGNVALAVGVATALALLVYGSLRWRTRRRGTGETVGIPWVGLAIGLLLFAGIVWTNVTYYETVPESETALRTYGWPFGAVGETFPLSPEPFFRKVDHAALLANMVLAFLVPVVAGGTCELLLRLLSRIAVKKPAELGETNRDTPRPGGAHFSLASLLAAVLVAGVVLWANFEPGIHFYPELGTTQRHFGWPYDVIVQVNPNFPRPSELPQWHRVYPEDWHPAAIIWNVAHGAAFSFAALLLSEILVRVKAFRALCRLRAGSLLLMLAASVALMTASVFPKNVAREEQLGLKRGGRYCLRLTEHYGWPFPALEVRLNGNLLGMWWQRSWWWKWGLAGDVAVALAILVATGAVWEGTFRKRAQVDEACSLFSAPRA